MGGPCHRISTFLSVMDIHVQNAPVGGENRFFQTYRRPIPQRAQAGFGALNENVLIGFDSAETPGEKIGVRLIAGVLARRIVPFVQRGTKSSAGSASASFNSAPGAIFTCRWITRSRSKRATK